MSIVLLSTLHNVSKYSINCDIADFIFYGDQICKKVLANYKSFHFGLELS